MTNNFKIGDRVKCIKEDSIANRPLLGKTGIVREILLYNVGVEFDEYIHGHDLSDCCKDGHGWYLENGNLEKMAESPKQDTPDTRYVDPKTVQIGDRVRSRQKVEAYAGVNYTGVVVRIESKCIRVKRNNIENDLWTCRIVGDKVATACGLWDNKSFLEILTIKTGGDIKMGECEEEERLNELTKFLSNSLSKDEQNYYRLGWINVFKNEIVVTAGGIKASAFCAMLAGGDIKSYAANEVSRRETEEKRAQKAKK